MKKRHQQPQNRTVLKSVVAITIDTDLLREVDDLAGRLKMSRSAFLSSLVKFGVDDNRLIIKAVSAMMPMFSQEWIRESLCDA